ncbi:hypothetical protein [Limoniibacter endophyticus]|uniref:Uncharacterized protein n=1 Tax=Limoniibacter endophyticus TaxID=1565040 RepID=A0A8J3DM30_9HYPH|nr:hypothetical protein [Limoniibacter endophyticus]GHC69432.1 hypothetical protein GCM10010136_15260 [Limoniibacter endophyticus]
MIEKGDLACRFKGDGMKIGYRSAISPSLIRSVRRRKNLGSETLDTLFSDGGSSYFCSEFVVLCYQIAIEQNAILGDLRTKAIAKTFNLDSASYLPSYLWQVLHQSPHFQKIGTVQAGEQIA